MVDGGHRNHLFCAADCGQNIDVSDAGLRRNSRGMDDLLNKNHPAGERQDRHLRSEDCRQPDEEEGRAAWGYS